MYYEINVDKDDKHFFATAKRSIISWTHLKQVYRELDKRFPSKDGYRIQVIKYEIVGKTINILANIAKTAIV